jgi:hypothetical protein
MSASRWPRSSRRSPSRTLERGFSRSGSRPARAPVGRSHRESHGLLRPAGWIRKAPILDRDADHRAFAFRAAHGDDSVCTGGQLGRHQPGLRVGEVDSDLTHRLDHLRVDLGRRPGTRRIGGGAAVRVQERSCHLAATRIVSAHEENPWPVVLSHNTTLPPCPSSHCPLRVLRRM